MKAYDKRYSLPFDFSRCTGENCKIRDECARYTSPGRPEYQAYMPPPPDIDNCENYINNKETKL